MGRNQRVVAEFQFELTDEGARMTNEASTEGEPMQTLVPSRCGELDLDLMGLRLNGAQLGQMLGVSRQAVSAAVKRGTIAPAGPDGLFDARRAVRDWMNNSDPTRVRARALKPGAEALAELREKAKNLADEVNRLQRELAIEEEWGDKREEAATFRAEMKADRRLVRFTTVLEERFAESITAHAAGRLNGWLDELVAVAFYGQDLDEFRRAFAECEEDERPAQSTGCPDVPTAIAD